jgi:hypothetical protein
LSEANRDEVITGLKSFVAVHLVVGDNWIINSDDADGFADALGGTVVTSPAP